MTLNRISLAGDAEIPAPGVSPKKGLGTFFVCLYPTCLPPVSLPCPDFFARQAIIRTKSSMHRPTARLGSALLLIVAVALAPLVQATCGGGGGGGRGGAVPASNMGASQPMMPDLPQVDSRLPMSPGIGGNSGNIYRVPWTLADQRNGLAEIQDASLLVIWFPSSSEVARDSRLHGSKVLTAANERCVIPVLVPVDNTALRQHYKIGPGVEAVVLADPDGTEVQRLVNRPQEMLGARAMEQALQSELSRREKALQALLDAASKRAKAGDKAAADDLQKVWAARCLAPSLGKKAAKALRKLGIEVSQTDVDRLGADALADADTANAHREVEPLLGQGLEAELAGHYRVAEGFYREAVESDPADTTALRYLGELYRHQTGEWDKAGRVFRQILSQPSDQIARAVALHGLGKMTIHAGSYTAGLRMFQQSIATYPLPITYRNLAVYWFSEGQQEKAAGYMRQALALDPYDTYNRIFAAVYLAAAGHKEEAIKIAQQNESVLEASYNLAAIWAQVGDRAKAMELLRRHFTDYERYMAVRAMEMKEAREDYMFASLHRDPEFLELTKQARAAYLIGAEWCSPDQLINQPEVQVRMPGGTGPN